MIPSMLDSKGSSLRQLRLILGREATRPETRPATLLDLQSRLQELLGDGSGLLLGRWPGGSKPLEALLDTGFPRLRPPVAPEIDSSPEPPQLSLTLIAQILESQEAHLLKTTELGQLWATPEPEPMEAGSLPPRPTKTSAAIAPVSKNVVLLVWGPDLGPEDLGIAEELGQFLLLLHEGITQRTASSQSVERFLETSREPIYSGDLQQSLQKVAEQLRDDVGYEVVAISLVDGQLVHNKVLLGLEDEARARFSGWTSALEDRQRFLDPRFQLGNSYFIPRDADVYTEQTSYCLYCPQMESRPEGMWQPGDNFITAFQGIDGEIRGTVSLDCPRDGRRPSLETARLLELYASRTAAIVEASDHILQLTRVNQELRDLDRMRAEFIANISHELHTPVASILGYAHLLLDHGCDNLSDRQRHFLAVLSKSTERLSSLVDNLIDVSAMNAEDPSLKCERLDLREVYREVLVRLNAQIRVHKLEMRESLGKEAMMVVGDRHQLRQVFFGILSNAVLFSRDQGHIQVDMERASAGMISVRIADSGPGLSRDKLHEMLDRFYQVDHEKKRVDLDNRMGLCIAYKHVRAHRGNLILQSEEGTGTRVTVTLPAANGAY